MSQLSELHAAKMQLEEYKDKYNRLLQAIGEAGYWLIQDDSKRMHLIKKEDIHLGIKNDSTGNN